MPDAVLTAYEEPLEIQAVERREPAPDGVLAELAAMADSASVGIPVVNQYA